ncbi:TetR/AcrR family transcriptional regulator [Amycolatopsis halotolerans]|uniref:TetR/AcrR family transcriptional regulator n=1 Tax=Amycolatopsis halotolerans TaxID=330083 RepID=UPI0036122E9E
MATGSKPLRADAARNRDKLLAAATRAFGEHGLDAPLEQIARSAGVSIGTLYAHFPTRDAFVDAILPAQLAALDDLATKALAEPDPCRASPASSTDCLPYRPRTTDSATHSPGGCR